MDDVVEASANVTVIDHRGDATVIGRCQVRAEADGLFADDTRLAAMWGDQIGEAYGAGGLGLTGVGEGGGGSGGGIGLGSFGSVGHGSGAAASSVLEVGNLAAVQTASGSEAGALFVYALPRAVSLHAHASLLVPFVDQKVEAAPLAWFESEGAKARSAVRFVNSTSQTLPPGTVAFFADHGFAGESALPRLKPGERRFLGFGLDLDVELTSKDRKVVDTPKRLLWNKASEAVEEHFLHTTDVTYVIENRSGQRRGVVLSTTLATNATLTGTDGVDFDGQTGRPLGVFAVKARSKEERKVHSVEGLERTLHFASLTAAWLTEIAGSAELEASERAIATEAAARLTEVEADHKAGEQAKADLAELEKDATRLRDHMRAVAGDRANAQQNPFAARVIAVEDKLVALRVKSAELEADAQIKLRLAKAALARLTR